MGLLALGVLAGKGVNSRTRPGALRVVDQAIWRQIPGSLLGHEDSGLDDRSFSYSPAF